MNNSAPCKYCLDRKPLCHGSCELYKQYKISQANVQAARAEYMNQRSIKAESVSRGKKKLLERRA